MDTTDTAGRPLTLSTVTGDLHAQLAKLERMASRIGISVPGDNDTTTALVEALLAVDRQHPGAWVSLKIAADYRTERSRNAAMQRAVRELVRQQRVEALNVHFREGERRLYRIAAGHDDIDIDAVVKATNAALVPAKYKVVAYPARLVDTNFTRHTITHAGRTATAYLRIRQYDFRMYPTKE